jgi:hypothetical protein
MASVAVPEMLLLYSVHIQVKEILSVSTAGELAQVPEAVLRKHFGEKTAAIISDKAKGVSFLQHTCIPHTLMQCRFSLSRLVITDVMIHIHC